MDIRLQYVAESATHRVECEISKGFSGLKQSLFVALARISSRIMALSRGNQLFGGLTTYRRINSCETIVRELIQRRKKGKIRTSTGEVISSKKQSKYLSCASDVYPSRHRPPEPQPCPMVLQSSSVSQSHQENYL